MRHAILNGKPCNPASQADRTLHGIASLHPHHDLQHVQSPCRVRRLDAHLLDGLHAMTRALLFVVIAAVTGCGCTNVLWGTGDRNPPLPERTVRGVAVSGPYTDADVVAILARVRTKMGESSPILFIQPPHEIREQYLRGKLEHDALPVDVADVVVDAGWYVVYHMKKQEGVWGVRDVSGYITWRDRPSNPHSQPTPG